eukprot:COSAG02_NODE_29388_length_570_cov_0.878981_1_plen_56_part_10
MHRPPFSQGDGVPTASQMWCSQTTPRQPTLQAHENVGSTPCSAVVHATEVSTATAA